MNAKKSLLIVFLFLSLSVSAEVEFSGLDITPANNLLFLASTDLPGFGSYETLFLAGLKEKKLKQLTFFPEKISFLKESKQLQIQNRYGVFRSDSRLQNIAPIDLFPSFVKGREIATGKITPIHASPDGKYLVFIRQKSAAYGDLVLYDHIKSIETVVSEKVECSLTDPAALWSPDSKTFAYSTGGNIYYFSIHQYEQKTVMSEEYRKVNEGTIKSAQWGNDSNLYYIAGTLVYRIGSREFFTKSLYSGLLKAGEIAGKIPFPFNPNFDSFLISPDGKKILLNKEGRNLFLYYLNPADFAATGSPTSLPYLFLPRNAVVKQVLWSSGDSVTLLASGIVKGESISSLFRLDVDDEYPPSAFKKLEETGIQSLYLSPGEKTVALLKKDRVLIYDYVSWVKTDEMRFSQPLSAIWRSDSELLIAGKYTIKLYNTSINSSKLIALSQPEEYGYTKDSRFIQVRVDDGNYQREPESAGWESTNTFSV
ncbi:MAG TPA: polysaccharide deacetylase family protein, partial [Spirochaetia bacterium]|nr:polysaccharide deacetylase family protein [Spirochaetia bacterium]